MYIFIWGESSIKMRAPGERCHTHTHAHACMPEPQRADAERRAPSRGPARTSRAAGPSWSQCWHGCALGTCFLLTGTGTTEEGKGK